GVPHGVRDVLHVPACADQSGGVVVYGAVVPLHLRRFRTKPKMSTGNRHVPGLIPLKLTIAEIRAAGVVPPVAGDPLAAVDRRPVDPAFNTQAPPSGLARSFARASGGDRRSRGRDVSNRRILGGCRARRAERHCRQEEYLALHLQSLGYATPQACPRPDTFP